MEVKLDNTFVIRTDDEKFEQALIEFLSNHCDSNNANAIYFNLNKEGAEKVMAIVQEK